MCLAFHFQQMANTDWFIYMSVSFNWFTVDQQSCIQKLRTLLDTLKHYLSFKLRRYHKLDLVLWFYLGSHALPFPTFMSHCERHKLRRVARNSSLALPLPRDSMKSLERKSRFLPFTSIVNGDGVSDDVPCQNYCDTWFIWHPALLLHSRFLANWPQTRTD